MARIIEAFAQFFDGSGNPLVDGFLKFNETGTNNTDKDTFADISETIGNDNPLQLDGEGRCPNVFGSGSYNVISFKDSIITPGAPGEQIQQFDPVGGNLEGSAFSDWNASTTYSIGDKVRGSDGEDYQSITNNNQNNNPTSSPTNWELLRLGRVWNANVTYSAFDSAYGSDGKLYTSLVGSNLNNDPVTDFGTNWGNSSTTGFDPWDAARTYAIGNGATGTDGLIYYSLISPNLNIDPVADATTSWRASDQVRSAAAAGTVDAITATFIPAVGALKDGIMVRVRASGANTITNPTFAPDGLTAKTIKKDGNQALAIGDIPAAGYEMMLVRNTSNDVWELMNPSASSLSVIFTKEFQSTAQTIVSGGLITLAHGLGAQPKNIRLYVVNTTTQSGYSPGDLVEVPTVNSGDAANNRTSGVFFDATNVNVRMSSATSVFIGADKTTGATVVFTNANWDLFIEVYA
jgi:hypothetical protein